MQHKIILIGLGKIGALNDLHVKHEHPLSHLEAIALNDRIEIAALIDQDREKIKQIQSVKNISSNIFLNGTDSIVNTDAKIVVFACPPENRIEQLKSCLKIKPQVIVFEKPLSLTLSEGLEIKRLCDSENLKAVVNFHRRYDEGHNIFKRNLPEEAPSKIVFNYSKGLWNYGSHGIDLIQNWFGHITEARGLTLKTSGQDHVDAFLKLETGTTVHLVSHNTNYDLFELEFFYDNEKYALRDGGIRKTKQVIMPDLHHTGYNHLGPEKDIVPPGKVYGLQNLYADIVKVCENPLHTLKGCTLDEALSGIKTIETLIQTAQGKA